MVVRQHQVFHRLVCVLAQLRQPVTGGPGRGSGLERDQEVFTLNGAHVGVALGGQCVNTVSQYFKGFHLLTEVGGRCKRFFRHMPESPVSKEKIG
jgi:hypothetical protein